MARIEKVTVNTLITENICIICCLLTSNDAKNEIFAISFNLFILLIIFNI